METAIGIDLGGSSVKSVAITSAGGVLKQLNLAFDDSRPMDWADKIRESHTQLTGDLEMGLCPVGLSAPGLTHQDGNSIAYMPGRLQGLEGLNFGEFLHLANPVPTLNDAHAALYGEAWVGAAKGFNNVILLTLGTGVGGAAMVDGRLLRGAIGRAGHLGHLCLDPEGTPDVCGTPGSLEVAIGNCTIQERTNGQFESTHDLIRAHQAGNAEASAYWLKSVKALACGICSLINILDPEAVIIGGGIARAGPLLFEPLRDYLSPIEWRPGGHHAQILPAQLGEFAGAIGAARKALSL